MQQNTASNPFSVAAYGDRPQMGLDVEFGSDPASGAAFFQSDGRKHDDLKQMLDSNKDGLKLEAMKRIIGMIARGRDASDLFPAVVKNVVSKNIEVKKLVYVYLVRYAEEQQDLALLSISTFQRALKDPNQLIRASALRVLSSIRVSMIVPIVMLAIRDSAADLSPYVRKTAAHAIPKLYSLDADQKDELVTVIEKLLSDRTTLVVGSAVMAFDEVRDQFRCETPILFQLTLSPSLGLSRTCRSHPQELSQAVQSAGRCGRMGSGDYHQYADAICAHTVRRSQWGRGSGQYGWTRWRGAGE